MVIEQCIMMFSSLLVAFGAFYMCKQSSAYYHALRWKAFIRIRSDFLCRIFISQAIKGRKGRLVYVAPQDEHKITCLGLLSHLIVDSLAVRHIYVSIQYGFLQTGSMETVQKTLSYLIVASLITALAGTINAYKVG